MIFVVHLLSLLSEFDFEGYISLIMNMKIKSDVFTLLHEFKVGHNFT